MKELFSKIAGLTLCLTFATGVVALGFSNTNKSVKASEAVIYKLDGSIVGTKNGFATDNPISQGGKNWLVNGNTTVSPWKIGGNKNNGLETAGTVRMVQSQGTVSTENITKVVLTTSKPSSSSITPTNVSLKVGTSIGGSTISSLSNGSWAASITFNRPSGADWSSKYFEIDFTMPANTTTTNKYISFISAEFYYDAPVERGEISIGGLDSIFYYVGNTKTLSVGWDPLNSSATVKSSSWSSSDSTVLSFSGNTFTANGPGTAKITLNVTDSNDQEYSVQSEAIYVSNSYNFNIGDNVAMVNAGEAKIELGGIEKASNYYGTGVAYTTVPNGTYSLVVEEGSVDGSLSFKHGDNYLSVQSNSSNNLNVNAAKDGKTSWYVVQFSSYSIVYNVEFPNRQIWWNDNETNGQRFVCYENKTHGNSKYYGVNFVVLEELPVRGEITIASPDSNTTTLKQGVTGNLTYDWVPAEGTSTTISSHTWTSNHPEYISIDGDTYTAVAPGKAKITLSATDSTGQIYSVTTAKDIEVIAVVSGSYAKVTSIADGDVVTFVCEYCETQIHEVKSDMGTYVYYNSAPASVLDFTVVASGNYFAFKTSDNKYLTWKESTKIGLVEELTDLSYWSVGFQEGSAFIQSKDSNGSNRAILFSIESPRFGYYTGGEKYASIQLYAPVTSYDSTAVAFAQEFLVSLECDNGVTQPDTATWNDLMTDAWTNVNETGRGQLAIARAIIHENPATDQEYVEAAMARYDYVIAKYGSTMYDDYIGRNPAPLRNVVDIPVSISESPNTLLVVVIFTTVSISSMILLLVIKRKRHY